MMANNTEQIAILKEQTSKLNAQFPVLLMPVKLQVRFMTIKHVAAIKQQEAVVDTAITALPITPAIATLAQTLSNHLTTDASASGLILPGEKLAVGTPDLPAIKFPIKADEKELWVRIYPDEIMIHSHEERLTPDELRAGQNYWKEIWQAESYTDLENNPSPEQLKAKKKQLKIGAWKALVIGAGAPRASFIKAQTQPNNHTGAEVELTEVPVFSAIETVSDTWTQAPKVKVLPRRFIIRLEKEGQDPIECIGNEVPNPLPVGFNPNGGVDPNLNPKESALQEQVEGAKFQQGILPEDLRWLSDFSAAERVGMGVSIPLTTAQANEGFDKITVLGIHTEEDPLKNQVLIEELLDNHLCKPGGMSIVPKGTPSNNTKQKKVGKGPEDMEAEESFEIEHCPLEEATTTIEKCDGQRLAEAFGIKNKLFQKLGNANKKNLGGAEKMNQLLSAATLDYFLNQIFHGDINEETIGKAKDFFVQQVKGGGNLPTLRIDNQPYGVLATTAFSKLEFDNQDLFEKGLFTKILQPLKSIWEEIASQKVAHIKKGLDATATSELFYQLMGLHATSQTFYQRLTFGEKFLQIGQEYDEDLKNHFDKRLELQDKISTYLNTNNLDVGNSQVKYKYYYPNERGKLTGPKVTRKIDYLALLADADIEAIINETFLPNEAKPPRALLYLLARHAILQVFLKEANKLAEPGERKFNLDLEIIGEESVDAYDFIINKFENIDETAHPSIVQLRSYLRDLSKLSDDLLEQLLVDHLDSCNYRLDAWLLALVNQRLEKFRATPENKMGLYFGAFGYLENVKKEGASGIAIRLHEAAIVDTDTEIIVPLFNFSNPVDGITEKLNKSYVYLGAAGLSDDFVFDEATLKKNELLDVKELPIIAQVKTNDKNQGFIPAPSTNHAITAAVLRSGYLAHQKDGSKEETFATNLNSKRVREALFLLEGMKNGQELGALLGYKFERALHDQNLDKYIFDIRQEFPFESSALAEVNNSNAQETTVADNVVNGLELLGDRPKALTLVEATDKNKVIAILDFLEDCLDAFKDLLTAESVYQLVNGRPERARAALLAQNDGEYPLEPEIVNTPRSGQVVNLRMGIFLPPNEFPSVWNAAASPRSFMDGRLNMWLNNKLPAPALVKIRTRWLKDPANTDSPEYEYHNIDLMNLTYQPIDFIYSYYHQRHHQNQSELHYRVDYVIRLAKGLKDNQVVEIMEKDRTDFKTNEMTLFAIEPLVLGLGEILMNARPMRPKDLYPANDPAIENANNRIKATFLKNRLNTALSTLNQYNQAFTPWVNSAMQHLENWNGEAGLDIEYGQNNAALLKNIRKNIRKHLMKYVNFGWTNALPPLQRSADLSPYTTLVRQAKLILELSKEKYDQLTASLQDVVFTDLSTDEEKVTAMTKFIQELFDKSFKVFSEFSMANHADLKLANQKTIIHQDDNLEMERWLQTLVPIRPKSNLYHKMAMLTNLFKTNDRDKFLRPLQLPLDADYQNADGTTYWAGTPYETDYQPHPDAMSLAFEVVPNFSFKGFQTGFILDEWSELLPEKETNAGIAMHYDQPNNEAPNTILLAVSPKLEGNWEWDDVMDTVCETVELAKLRAVDPDLLKEKAISQFLPGVYAAISDEHKAISLDFGNNMSNTKFGKKGRIMKNYDLDKKLAGEIKLEAMKVNLGDLLPKVVKKD